MKKRVSERREEERREKGLAGDYCTFGSSVRIRRRVSARTQSYFPPARYGFL